MVEQEAQVFLETDGTSQVNKSAPQFIHLKIHLEIFQSVVTGGAAKGR